MGDFQTIHLRLLEMAFFKDSQGNYYLNTFVKEPDSCKTYYAYIIPTVKTRNYISLLWTSIVMAITSFFCNVMYIIYSLYFGSRIEHMTVGMLCTGSVLAILIIAIRNLFLNVEKVQLKGLLLQGNPTKLLYILVVLVTLNMLIAFLFIGMNNFLIGNILFLLLGLIINNLNNTTNK